LEASEQSDALCCWVPLPLAEVLYLSFLPYLQAQYLEFLGVNNPNLERKHLPSQSYDLPLGDGTVGWWW
jgi:hypothetical protein